MTGESLPVTLTRATDPHCLVLKFGEVDATVRVTSNNTELGKIISTIANTIRDGHFELFI